MTMTLPVIETTINRLTHSSETCFRTCPRKYRLSYELGLRPDHDGDALRVGSAFHVGLDILKKGGAKDAALDAVRETYRHATCPPWLEAIDFATEREMAVGMVAGYANRYANDQIVTYVAAEISFDLPILHPTTGKEIEGWRNCGKIDGIGQLPDGRLALIEHKTSGEDIGPGADYWQRLMLDAQVSRYVLAARAMGHDVQATIFDVTRKPFIRPKNISKAERADSTAKGHYFGFDLHEMCPERETPELYGARLVADMATRPDFYFNRVEIARLDSDLGDFRHDQYATLKSINSCNRYEFFPRNTSACTSPYRCQFLDVCRGMRGNPNERVPDGFVKVSNVHPELS